MRSEKKDQRVMFRPNEAMQRDAIAGLLAHSGFVAEWLRQSPVVEKTESN